VNNPQDLSQAFLPPSAAHWLGCDAYGADLGLRLVEGAWISVRTGIAVTLITLSVGLAVGTLSALSPPAARTTIRRVIDTFLAFPGLLLAILLASILPPSDATVIVALAVTGWAGHARFCEGLVLRTASLPFVEAATAGGATPARVITRHIWPAILGQLAVQGILSFAHVILGEASLSFLGLGGPVDSSSWGRLVAEGRDYLVEAPHLSLFPGLALVVALSALQLFASRLRKRLDPSIRQGVY